MEIYTLKDQTLWKIQGLGNYGSIIETQFSSYIISQRLFYSLHFYLLAFP